MSVNPSFEPSKQNAVKPLGSGEAVVKPAGFKLLVNPSPHSCSECKDSRVIETPCLSCCQNEAVEEIKEQLDFYAEWDREIG